MKKEVLYIVIPILILFTLAFFFRGTITGLVASEERFRVVVTLKIPEPLISGIAGAVTADNEVEEQAVIDAMKVKAAIVQQEVISDVNGGGLFAFMKDDDLIVEKKYDVIPAMVVHVNEEGLQDLLNNPFVENVFFDYAFSIDLADSVPQINATAAPIFNVSGKDVGVCVIDTGIDYNHSAFEDRIVAQHCFCYGCCPNGQSEDTNAYDDNTVSHGTHVSGIVASNGIVKGVAPQANIIAVKVCDNQGTCYTSDIISGIDFCIQNKVNYNIQVISGSLGDGGAHTPETCPTFIDSTLAAAAAVDIFLVFASGNNGYSTGVNYPSCYHDAISVGAVTKQDAIASFSNYGPGLDFFAPGAGIRSTIAGNTYGYLSGTSQATPHVSGFIPLLLEFAQKFNLSRQDVVDSMNKTNTLMAGFPRINIGMALGYLADLANYSYLEETNQTNTTNSFPELTVVSPLNNSQIFNPVLFSASAFDSDDGKLNITWFLLNETYFGNFSLNLSEGNYSIQTSVIDSENASVSQTVFFSVMINQTNETNYTNSPPVVEIISPLNNSFVGRNVNLVGNVSDEDENISGIWSSSIQGILGEGRELNVLLTNGSHIITFSSTDSENLTGSMSINLFVGSCLIDFDRNINSQLDIGDIVILFNEFLNNSLTDTSGAFCSQSGTCLIEFDRNNNVIYDIGDIVLLFNGFLNNNITKPSGENCFN